MFIGRNQELTALNKLYQEDSFQFAVIYGRRRIGKTSLINQFLKGKQAIYFTGLEENALENLARFSDAIHAFEDPSYLDGPNFASFEQAFKYLVHLSEKNDRLILVIDEFPYLAKAYPPISSMLQSYIDHYFKQNKLFIILCGSSMSFMEKQVLGYKSPLYGRRTAQFKLKPFSLHDAEEFFPQLNKEEVFELNAITGGIPLYLSFMSPEKSLRDNIKDNFLTTSAMLYAEPMSLLNQELREPASYSSIISAIAAGASRLSEISTKTGIASGALSPYLDNLIDLGIVEKRVPVTEIDKARSRKTIYAIKDGMFRFWYTFVGKRVSFIERGITGPILDYILKQLPHFMGPEFEKLSQEYLWSKLFDPELVPEPFVNLGNWWGPDPKEKKQVEMDIVGFDDQKLNGYFGECKWKNEPISADILETLIYRSSPFPSPKKNYYLFSKTGFTDKCRHLARQVDCHLITFNMM